MEKCRNEYSLVSGCIQEFRLYRFRLQALLRPEREKKKGTKTNHPNGSFVRCKYNREEVKTCVYSVRDFVRLCPIFMNIVRAMNF